MRIAYSRKNAHFAPLTYWLGAGLNSSSSVCLVAQLVALRGNRYKCHLIYVRKWPGPIYAKGIHSSEVRASDVLPSLVIWTKTTGYLVACMVRDYLAIDR